MRHVVEQSWRSDLDASVRYRAVGGLRGPDSSLDDRYIDDVLIAGNDSPLRSRPVIVISNRVLA